MEEKSRFEDASFSKTELKHTLVTRHIASILPYNKSLPINTFEEENLSAMSDECLGLSAFHFCSVVNSLSWLH